MSFSQRRPLEALRTLLSHAASGRGNGTAVLKILLVDARKARLHALVERNISGDLRPEEHIPGMRARLNRWF